MDQRDNIYIKTNWKLPQKYSRIWAGKLEMYRKIRYKIDQKSQLLRLSARSSPTFVELSKSRNIKYEKTFKPSQRFT